MCTACLLQTNKCIIFSKFTVARGKRQWKAYYAYLKGFLLYFAPVSLILLPEHGYTHDLYLVLHLCTYVLLLL